MPAAELLKLIQLVEMMISIDLDTFELMTTTAFAYIGPRHKELVGYFLLDTRGFVYASGAIVDQNNVPS